MDKNILKWLQDNIIKYELNKSNDSKDMIYVLEKESEKLKKHLDRIKKKYKSSYVCNYEWTEIILE